MLQQRGRVLAILRKQTDPEACCHGEFVALHEEALLQTGQQPEGDIAGRILVVHGGRDQRELIAPHSGECLALSHGAFHASYELFEQEVASCVAQRVVDELEAVKVEIKHAKSRVAGARRLKAGVKERLKTAPVGESGERVVRGLPGQFTLRLFSVRDVTADTANEVAFSEFQMVKRDFNRDQRAGFSPVPGFDKNGVRGACGRESRELDGIRQILQGRSAKQYLPVPSRVDIGGPHVQQFLRVIAQHAARSLIGVDDPVVGVHPEDRIRRSFYRKLAKPEGFLGLDAFGNIEGHGANEFVTSIVGEGKVQAQKRKYFAAGKPNGLS